MATAALHPATDLHQRITERWLEGEHGRIRCWLATPQHGIPLLLIHGYGALIEHWRRLFPLLHEYHTPCAFDLYNFGYSARVPVHLTPGKKVWTAQVAQVIEEMFDAPAVVVGHSMGGMVAAQLANDHPELVRGLVLVNSVGLPPDRTPTAFERTFFGMVRTPGVGEVLAGVMMNPWAVRQGLLSSYYRKERVTPELVEAFSGALRRPGAAQALLAVSRSFNDFLLDFVPGAVQSRTFIIWGEKDRSMPPSLATRFKEALFPEAEIAIIPETGHCPFDENPEAFAAALLPWMERLPRSGVDQSQSR